MSSSMAMAGFSSSARQPEITSFRLWGGILVAIPTAMPAEPLISRLGMRAGRIRGSFFRNRRSWDRKSTVSLSISSRSWWPILAMPHFGVTHGGGIVAVHRTEIALTVPSSM